MSTHIALLPNDLWDVLSLGPSSPPRTPMNFVRLPHPRTGVPTLFLPSKHAPRQDGDDGLDPEADCVLEIQQVTPPNPRSWFVGDEVVSDGKLTFLAPVDPVFLLIHMLRCLPKDQISQFRPADDIFEDLALKLEVSSASKEPSLHVLSKDVQRFTSLRCCKDALDRICEVERVGSEIVVYRFSQEKAVAYLRQKVERLSKPEVIDSSRILTRNLAKDGLMEDEKEDILEMGRMKSACDLVSQYLTPDFRTLLLASYDFAKLDEYLQRLENERMCVDVPAAGNKKVKKEGTGDKRKKGAAKASSGVEKLKKANTNGMAKLSTFFAKKT
ncbi:hypothetical protein AAF712_004134 [Marasmius tenuissimus]|uniref:Ribonuclease H2 subunit B n=1 Tax=Marasmius tenuissimus TaxID=585030 RepID=A0ABR3A4B6_9AGAR|nr:hypothetical protein PM082_001678 [Marasmius tenuissimus]